MHVTTQREGPNSGLLECPSTEAAAMLTNRQAQVLSMASNRRQYAEYPSSSQPHYREQKRTLSPRQIEVLTWAARGKLASEIAAILHISKRTVYMHACAAVKKLGARNHMHAVATATRDGLIDL
jgi:DNA-binding NarL/FixJ family response regulator